MTQEELGMIARRQEFVSKQEWEMTLFSVRSGFELLRDRTHQRNGVAWAQKNFSDLQDLQRDLADFVSEIGHTIDIQRAAE